MSHYIIHVIAFQLAFLLSYDLFLKRETFFNWNRLYLISTALLSLCIPFIKIETFKNTVPQKFIINLSEVVIGQATANPSKATPINDMIVTSQPMFTWEHVLYAGIIIATLLFVIKVVKLLKIISQSPKSKTEQIVIVKLLKSNAAFSFFNYIFLGDLLNEANKEAILKHEIVHVKQKHTLDLLFFEVLRILFWFNPLMYMYQNRMMSLHEYIADSEVVKQQDKASYYQNLLSQVFETKNMSFINPFYKQSLIKKRIIMLTKSKSKQVNLIKYALLIPMVIGMLVYTSSQAQEKPQQLDLNQYSYTVLLEEKEMSAETKASREKYEAFLKANPDYVSWLIFDEDTKTASYSVHSINDKIPDGFKSRVSSTGTSGYKAPYIEYVYFKNTPETEESKKKKQEELLKQKEAYKDASEVPFAVIDQAPIFPGCEGLSEDDQKDCVRKKITEHVSKNFNINIATENNLVGRQRMNVIFKIDRNGAIIDVRARAPHPALENEAIRVISTLPKMTAGEHKGKKVTVPYSLPIVFQVAEEKKND